MIWRTFIIEIEGWVYLKMPKCASTSMLKTYGNSVNIEGMNCFDKKVFSIVRNPYSRLVSCWADRCRTGNGLEHNYRMFWGLRHNMSFFDFASMVCNLPDEMSDIHFASMTSLAKHFIGRELDHFIRLENLEMEWGTLGFVGMPLKHEKKSKHRKWMSYYEKNPVLCEIVYRRYKRDFESFGYERLSFG